MLALLCAAPYLPAMADDRLQALLQGTEVTPALSGLQVSVMRGGEVVGHWAFGFAQVNEGFKTPLKTHHKIRVASVSKLAVAVGIMRLVERRQLELDADVSRYLGWTLRNPAFPDHPITLRQLLSHTSSLRDGERYFIPAGAGELRDFFEPGSGYWEAGVHYARGKGMQPGVFFEYANINFGVLGEVIERVAGQRFDHFMTEAVLAPLGVDASFNACDILKHQRAAAFRKRRGNAEWDVNGPWFAQVDAGPPVCFYGMEAHPLGRGFLDDYELGSNGTLFSPQGGLRASARDLLRVLQMLAAGGRWQAQPLLQPASVGMMLAPAWQLNATGNNGRSAGEAEPGGPAEGLMTSYGLSVHRIDMRDWGFTEAPPVLVGHLGEAYGVLSHALFDPLSGDGIATIITGTADDPGRFPGHSPLYRIEEAVLRWWLTTDFEAPRRTHCDDC